MISKYEYDLICEAADELGMTVDAVGKDGDKLKVKLRPGVTLVVSSGLGLHTREARLKTYKTRLREEVAERLNTHRSRLREAVDGIQRIDQLLMSSDGIDTRIPYRPKGAMWWLDELMYMGPKTIDEYEESWPTVYLSTLKVETDDDYSPLEDDDFQRFLRDTWLRQQIEDTSVIPRFADDYDEHDIIWTPEGFLEEGDVQRGDTYSLDDTPLYDDLSEAVRSVWPEGRSSLLSEELETLRDQFADEEE